MALQRTKARPSEPRDIVFISHASPADNDFARWLAFRLTREGYRVWVDLNELKGGEDWWRNIEHVLRNRASKFIVVVSRTSNDRDGVLKEIAVAGVVARTITNFIIPVRIDDLPHSDFNIEIKRYNGPDFSTGWAPAFAQLLEALERDKVPKHHKDGAQFAGDRWHEAFGGVTTVKVEQELYGSNWLRVDKRPEAIFWHERDGALPFDETLFSPPFPFQKVGNLFLSFASATDLAPAFQAAGTNVARSVTLDLREFTKGGLPGANIDATKAKDIVTFLYRTGIERYLAQAGLIRYEMASGKASFWFSAEKVGTQQHALRRPNNSTGRRALIGKAKRFTWHFALELRPAFNPWISLAVIPHVVFAEDGMIVASKRTQHSLRRRVCKQWFNDQWFDRILVALQQLGGEAGRIVVPLGGGATLQSGVVPDLFLSPVSYSWTPAAKAATASADTSADAEHDGEADSEEEDDDEPDDEIDGTDDEGGDDDEHAS